MSSAPVRRSPFTVHCSQSGSEFWVLSSVFCILYSVFFLLPYIVFSSQSIQGMSNRRSPFAVHRFSVVVHWAPFSVDSTPRSPVRIMLSALTSKSSKGRLAARSSLGCMNDCVRSDLAPSGFQIYRDHCLILQRALAESNCALSAESSPGGALPSRTNK
jgi:hypothetical protein